MLGRCPAGTHQQARYASAILSEELAAPPEDGAVEVAEDEGGEVRDVSPDRHVDDYPGAVAGVPGEGLHGGGVAPAVFSRQTNPGAWSAARYRVERFDESRQLRVVQGSVAGRC